MTRALAAMRDLWIDRIRTRIARRATSTAEHHFHPFRDAAARRALPPRSQETRSPLGLDGRLAAGRRATHARPARANAMAGSVYEGKSFEEAVRKGLEALRLTRAEAVITTIEEGKGGFLGIGARPFRVSVARRPGGAIREPGERTREARNTGDERRGGRRGGREARSGAPGSAGSGGAAGRAPAAGGS